MVDMDVDSEDPWDWGIEQVVAKLCSPDGLLKTRFPNACPDLSKLEEDLRENHIQGNFLLTEINDSNLKEDFQIRSIGRRASIIEVIKTLRGHSAKHIEHNNEHEHHPVAALEQAIRGLRYGSVRRSSQPPPVLKIEHHARDSPTPIPESPFVLDHDHLHPYEIPSSPRLSDVPVQSIEGQQAPVPGHDRARGADKRLRPKEVHVQGRGGNKKRKLKSEVIEILRRPGSSVSINRNTEATVSSTKRISIVPETLTDIKSTHPRGLLAIANGPQHEHEHSPSLHLSATKAPQSLGSEHRNLNNAPLGASNAMPVNRVFYGETTINQEIHFPVYLTTQERSSIENRYGLRWVKDWPVTVYVNTAQTPRPTDAQRIYINNRVKFFFLSCNAKSPRLFSNDPQISHGIQTYPANMLKYVGDKETPSMTVFSNGRALRVERRKWKELQVPESSEEGPYPAMDSRMAAHLRTDPDGHFSYLDHWVVSEDSSEALPALGESDSDEEYDSETWNEMEAERQEREAGKISGGSRALTSEIVWQTIDSSTAQYLDKWTAEKLPRLQLTGWNKWMESRKKGTSELDIENCEQTVERLNRRLTRLKRDMADLVWTNRKELQRQCMSLHESLGDWATSTWLIELYKEKSPPPRPSPSSRVVARKPRARPDSLEEGEEELTSDDGLGSFIVDDLPPTNRETDHASNRTILPSIENEDEGGSSDMDIDDQPTLPLPTDTMMLDDGPKDSQTEETLTKRRNAFDIGSSSDVEGAGLPLPSEKNDREDESPESLLGDVRQSPMPHPRRESIMPGEFATPGLSNDFQTVIDLTQESDGEEYEKAVLQIKTEDNEAQTEVNPTHQPSPETIFVPEDEADEAMEDIEPLIENHRSSPAHVKEPALDDIRAISQLDSAQLEIWARKKDSKRMLRWLIARNRQAREHVSVVTKGKSAAKIRPDVWIALQTWKSHGRKIKSRDKQDSDGLMQLAGWYIIWVTCTAPDRVYGIDAVTIKDTLESTPKQFEEYYGFLAEQLLWHKTNRLREPSKPAPSQKKAPFPFKKPEDQRPSTSTERPAKSSQGRKKSKILHESQEGIDLRSGAQARAKEREARSKELHRQLQALGGGGNLGIGTIVNPAKGENEEFILVNPHIGKSNFQD